jgi:hypothetical protein
LRDEALWDEVGTNAVGHDDGGGPAVTAIIWLKTVYTPTDHKLPLSAKILLSL